MVIVTAKSVNAKTGEVAATYAPIEGTCPHTCALRGNGCYAQSSRVGMMVGRMQKASAGLSPLQLAREEARGIRALDGADGRPLRLHVAGDSRTVKGTRVLAAAAAAYRAAGGGKVWTYTHAWRKVARAVWGPAVSVLASVETVAEGREARKQGYAPAVVVGTHPEDGKAWASNGTTWVPCPEQTRGVPCVDCGLCFDAERLHRKRMGIAFAVHGVSRKRALTVIGTQ